MSIRPNCAIQDYRDAPSGLGPLAFEWTDKPHRLVYDLASSLEDALKEVRRLRELHDAHCAMTCPG